MGSCWSGLTGVPVYILPPPSRVAVVLIDRFDLLIEQAAWTAAEMILGLILGLFLGAALAVRVRRVGRLATLGAAAGDRLAGHARDRDRAAARAVAGLRHGLQGRDGCPGDLLPGCQHALRRVAPHRPRLARSRPDDGCLAARRAAADPPAGRPARLRLRRAHCRRRGADRRGDRRVGRRQRRAGLPDDPIAGTRPDTARLRRPLPALPARPRALPRDRLGRPTTGALAIATRRMTMRYPDFKPILALVFASTALPASWRRTRSGSCSTGSSIPTTRRWSSPSSAACSPSTGLDVELIAPADPNAPPKLVAAGQADYAVSYQPTLQMLVAEGLPLVRVGVLVAQPLNSLVALEDSPVKTLADFKGRKIGYLDRGLRRGPAGRDARERGPHAEGRDADQRQLRADHGADEQAGRRRDRRLPQLRAQRPRVEQGQGPHLAGREERRADLRRADPGDQARDRRRGPHEEASGRGRRGHSLADGQSHRGLGDLLEVRQGTRQRSQPARLEGHAAAAG